MKKLYFGLLAAFCCTLFFASCSDDNGEGDDVVNESICGTWYNVRAYGENKYSGAWEEDYTDSDYQYYVAFYEDGTGNDREGTYPGFFTWTCDDRNLTITYYNGDYESYYIRKLTANELVLYSEEGEEGEGDSRWWCDVFVRVHKEL